MKMATHIHQQRCCLYTELRSLIKEVMVEGEELVASCMDTLDLTENNLLNPN
jgi:hypothetical protein